MKSRDSPEVMVVATVTLRSTFDGAPPASMYVWKP